MNNKTTHKTPNKQKPKQKLKQTNNKQKTTKTGKAAALHGNLIQIEST